MSASHCGHVLWAVRTMDKETIVPKLLQWLKADQGSLTTNSAIALGMLGDKSGLCCLRKIVRTFPEIPEEVPKGRYYLDFAKAITLIGRLQDEQCIEDLFDIMDCDGKKYSVNLKVGGYYRSISQYECNFVSLAITALLSIATNSVRRHEIWQRVTNWALKEREDEELEKLRKTVLAGLECRRENIC